MATSSVHVSHPEIEPVLYVAAHGAIRVAIQEVGQRRGEAELRQHLVQHGIDVRRRRVCGVERRSRVIQCDRLAIVPELPVAEIAAPFDIEPAGALQCHVLGRRVLQLLAGRQHVIEGDIGMEGELFRRADILAHLPQQPIRLVRHDRRGSVCRR